MPIKVTEADIEAFQRDGAICLRNALSKEWVGKITKGIEKNLENPSQYSEKLKTAEGPGYYFNDYCNWQEIEEFRDVVFNSPIAEFAGRLMRSKSAVFYHEHVLTKDPGTYKVTPWHQDQPYYPIDGAMNCSFWIPVDPVPKETTIQFVKGSHKWGKWFHPRKFATSLNYECEREVHCGRVYEEVPDVDGQQGHHDILSWEVKPGDCVVFHMLSLHGAPSNTTGTPRRVVSLRWLGDDSTLGERPWQVSPPIDGGLRPGEPVVCDTFPLVWSSA